MPDGRRCLKIVTQKLPEFTTEREDVLKSLDAAIFGTVALQRAARLGLLERREDGRNILLGSHELLHLCNDALQKVCC